jgi:hypothetical protein
VYDDNQILKDTKTGESVMRGRKSLVSIQLTDEEQRELEAIHLAFAHIFRP